MSDAAAGSTLSAAKDAPADSRKSRLSIRLLARNLSVGTVPSGAKPRKSPAVPDWLFRLAIYLDDFAPRSGIAIAWRPSVPTIVPGRTERADACSLWS